MSFDLTIPHSILVFPKPVITEISPAVFNTAIYSKSYPTYPGLTVLQTAHKSKVLNYPERWIAVINKEREFVEVLDYMSVATHDGGTLYDTCETWQVSVIPAFAVIPSNTLLHSQASALRDSSNKTRYFTELPTATELAAFAEKNTRKDTDRCIVLHRGAGTRNYVVCTDVELVSNSSDLI